MEIVKEQAPPGQACLQNMVLEGWVRVRDNQLVFVVGMNQVFKFVRIIARKGDSGKQFSLRRGCS